MPISSSDDDRARFLLRIFPGSSTDRESNNVICSCPNPKCGSRSKSKNKFSIRVDSGTYHCWVCDLKGKSLFYVLKKFNISFSRDEFIKLFGSLPIHADRDQQIQEEVVKLPPDVRLLATCTESRDPTVRTSLRYLESRGLNLESDLWRFKFCVSDQSKFRRRVIFPSFDACGELNYFVARTIDSDNKFKYVNAKAHKKSIIFNEINIDWTKELTVLEGPFDLTKSNYNSTCLMGSSLSTEHLLFQKIVNNKTPVLLCLDADVPQKAQKIARKLASYDVAVRILDLGAFKDVGEMSRKDFEDRRRISRRWTSDQLLLQKLSTLTGSFAAMQDDPFKNLEI